MLHLLVAFLMSFSAPAESKIIYGVASNNPSLNPYLLTGAENFTVTGFVIEPLARIEPFSQTLKPWLAREWKVDAKKKTVRVKLRSGVKFHNGEELAAEDVRFTWSSYFDPAYKGNIWRAMWSDVEDVKVVDPLTVEFRMKELRFQAFHNILTAMRILPKSFYQKVEHEKWTNTLVGSGPFKVSRFESNRSLDLAVNPEWWGWREFSLTPASPVMVKSVPDLKFAQQMMERGELDVYQVPSGEVVPLGAAVLKSAFGVGFSLGLNLRLGKLQDPRVRRALLLLWNREGLNQKIYGGKFHLSLDSFSAGTSYYPVGKPVTYDLAAAKKLLADAGYKSENPLALKILVNSPESERWVGLYQSDAEKAGVKITVEKVIDESQWWHLINQGKFELVAYDGAFSEKPHPSVWHSKGSYNSSGISDPELDKILDQLDREFDDTKRKKLISKGILYLREKAAEVPGLYNAQTHFLLSRAVTVDVLAPLQAWRWRKKDEQIAK